ncbi:MAG: putative polymerase bacteriophage-type,uracil-DNA glycosylase superfamily [Pseudomonadota bacterium]|jgi:DNA polymerase
MTLQLDARQRAMLAEMGVRLFDRAPAQAPADPDPVAAPVSRPAVGVPAAPVAPPPMAAPGRTLAPLAGPVADMDWDALAQAVASCQACGLCQSRRHTVFGVGDRQADWLVVGEAPGEMEDLQGEPFVGPAGQLLDNMLRAIGLGRHENVYIANVLKCRPPGNRNPEPAEVAQCEPFLRRQVALLKPKIILAMGRFAVQSLLGSSEPIGKLRGQIHQYEGVPVVVTYHPAYLLRNLPDKAKAWADLCLALDQVASAS